LLSIHRSCVFRIQEIGARGETLDVSALLNQRAYTRWHLKLIDRLIDNINDFEKRQTAITICQIPIKASNGGIQYLPPIHFNTQTITGAV